VPYIFGKLFSRSTFLFLTVCLYLAPFTSYKALKVPQRPEIAKNATGGITGDALGEGYRHMLYIFGKVFVEATFASQTYASVLKRFRVIKL